MISKRESRSLSLVLGILDMGVVFLAFSAALYLRFSVELIPLSGDIINVPRYWYLMVGILPIWWLNLAYFKLYNPQYLLHGNDEYQRVINAATTATVHTTVIIYILKANFARGWVLIAWVTATVFLMAGRFVHRRLHTWLIKRSGKKAPVVLVGANREAKTLADEIDRAGSLGMKVAGAVSWPMREPAPGLKIIGQLDDLIEVIKSTGAEAALVVPSALPPSAIPGIYYRLSKAKVAVYVSPSLFDIVASRATVLPISDMPLIRLQEVEFSGFKYFVKRAGDIFVSAILLAFLAPVFAVLAGLIKRESPGSAIFKQERVGRHGRKFMIYKFRTMVLNADIRKSELMHLNEATGPIFKIREDPRLTKTGKWLRRYSLDELPQLANVLAGHMSLVGPRPPTPDEVKTYGDWELRRLEVNPGMTGLWQIRGRSETTFEEMIRLDLYYIENWSPALDLYILLKTLGAVVRGTGAY